MQDKQDAGRGLQKQNMADVEERMESSEMDTNAQKDVDTPNAESQESVEQDHFSGSASQDAEQDDNIKKISITVKTPQDKKVIRVPAAANTKEVLF